MKNICLLLVVSLLFVFTSTGCKKDEKKDSPTPVPTVPNQYAFSDFETNTATAKAHTSALITLNNEMIKSRDVKNKVSETTLKNIFATGSPSLSDITDPMYRDSIMAWLGQIAAISGNAFDTLTIPNRKGGVAAGRLFTGRGVELDQLVEKGLFGAALFRQACLAHLSGNNLKASDIDKAFVYYGDDPAFSKNDQKAFFAAKYAVRRDKNRGTNGHYEVLKNAFLQARVAAINNNASEVSKQTAIIKTEWEKVLGATIINYLYSVSSTLSKTNITFAQRSSAWHAWAEAVGFLWGLSKVPAQHRIITDAQADEILTLMSAKSPYGIATDFNTPAGLNKLTTAINRLAQLYNFPDPTIYR